MGQAAMSPTTNTTGSVVAPATQAVLHRRLTVLEVLCASAEPVSLDRLSALVAASETDGREPSDDELEEVRITLHHIHLPKLAAADAITYDPGDGAIAEGPTARAVRSLIESVLETTAAGTAHTGTA